MLNIQEVKKGTSLDNDSNILFKTGKLVAKNPIVKYDKDTGKPIDAGEIDIGKIVSSGLEDMFGVFEFECYYPEPFETNKVLDVHTPFSITTLLKLENEYVFPNSEVVWEDLFDFIEGYIINRRLFDDETVKQVTELFDDYIRVDKFLPQNIEYIIYQLKSFLGKAKLDLIFKMYEELYMHNTWQKLIAEFDLKLSSLLAFSSDNNYIVKEVQTDRSLDSIATDLAKQFSNSMFASDKIKVNLSLEEDVEFNGAVWNITEDDSLIDYFPTHIPVEIVSRRIPFSQLANAIKFMSSLFARLDIKTTARTGLHLNIGFNSTIAVDLLKLVVLTSDDYELKLFDRADNKYCRSQLKALTENDRISITNERSMRLLWEQLKLFREKNNFPVVDTTSKYVAINFRKWVNPFPKLKPVLEFRIMGGTDYLKDVEKIIHRSNRFFYIMAVSANSELYKKEYINRIIRISGSMATRNKEDEDYWNLESLENLFISLHSRVKMWNKNKDELYGNNIEYFRDTVMEIIKSPVDRINFNLFKNVINPTVKDIYKNDQLRTILDKMKTDIKESGSKKDLGTFIRYFYNREDK